MIMRLVHHLIHLPLRVTYKLAYNLEIRGYENLKYLKPPVLIVANHKSLNDAFLVASSLPFSTNLFPVRYMAGSRFQSGLMKTLYKVGIIPFVYYVLGAFSITDNHDFEKKIAPAIKCLQKGETVILFPEGKRMLEDRVGDFKKGAGVIQKRTGVTVLPVAQRIITNNGTNKKIIYFGKPFVPATQDSQEKLDEINEKVTKLFAALKRNYA